MLAGFFLKKISATGAKAALVIGLTFYISCTFILKVDIHFVHIWGIEFLLNLVVMFGFSHFFPMEKEFKIKDLNIIEMKPWKHAKAMSFALCIITVLIYILLGTS